MNQNQVTITYNSIMYDIDDRINITSQGILGNKNGINVVMYNEENEGMAPVRTILKFNQDFLKVTKMGVKKTEMRYETGYTHNTVYHTLFGEFDMCIKTEEYTLQEVDNGFKITTVYNLEMDGNFVSKCRVEIEIK